MSVGEQRWYANGLAQLVSEFCDDPIELWAHDHQGWLMIEAVATLR